MADDREVNRQLNDTNGQRFVRSLASSADLPGDASAGWRLFAYRCLIALISVMAATALRFILAPFLGPYRVPFITYFPMVAFCAWQGGFLTGMLCVLFSTIVTTIFFVSPAFFLTSADPVNYWGLGLFVITSTGISALGEAQLRAHKRLEESLRELRSQQEDIVQGRELLATTLRSIGDAVITTDTKGRITSMNGVAETLTAWTEAQATGRPCREIFCIHNEHTGEEVESPVERVLREGMIVGLANHTILTARDGTKRFIDDSGAPIKDTQGQILGAVLVFRDISERKRMETAQTFLTEAVGTLASSLDYTQTLQKVARLAVPQIADWCTVDILQEDGTLDLLAVAHVDPAKVQWAYELRRNYPPTPDTKNGLCQVVRTGKTEVYPTITDELLMSLSLNEDHLSLMRQIGFASAMIVPMIARGRTLGAISLITTTESGHYFTEEDRVLAEGLASRAALAIENARLYQAAQQEIEERIKSAEEIRRSRHQLEVILEGIGDGITAQQPDGRIVFANTAAAISTGFSSVEEMFNTPPQTILSYYSLFDVDGSPLPLERLPGRRALQGEEAPERIVKVRWNRTGEERWMLLKARPVRDASGQVLLAINFLEDVTERRTAEQTLRQRQEEIEALNARLQRAMSETHHRVKNNLQVMSALVQMQVMQHEKAVPVQELQRLNHHIQALAAIHDLLTQQAKSDATVDKFSVRGVIEKLLPVIQAMVQDRSMQVSVEDAYLPVRQGTSLAVVINELVSNAIKHGKGDIGITFVVKEKSARLEVRDDGPGFPEDFDPLVSAHTGLELIESLARWDLQGTTCYENLPKGGGRVVIEFPLIEATAS